MALKNFNSSLIESGVSKKEIMKTTIFLVSMSDYSEMNKIYEEFFDGHRPARACVAVKELPAGAKFEIEAIGVVAEKKL